MVDWETVDVPRGSFIGWGKTKGQHVTGRVMDYNPVGGTDFDGNTCPQVDIELTESAASFNKNLDRVDHNPGDLITVTGGLDGLKKGLRRADPAVGDLLKIVMDGLEDISGGKTVKRFTIQIARGAAKKVNSAPKASAFAGSDDDPPF